MTTLDIAISRLFNQQIAETKFTNPADLVHWLGAVQAQDYGMAKWAIGLRLNACTNDTLENAINIGDIIRTHILRPTWHFVVASDVRWMLELTASHIKRAASPMYKKLELDDRVFSKTNEIIIRSLQGGRQLTRQELMLEINKEGINTGGLRSSHIMFQSELDLIVCNGAKRDKQFTYALLDERVPQSTTTFTRQEALAELAKRYFTSHGPATIKDFAWWSGLAITEAKLGLELSRSNFLSETIEGHTYWFSNSTTFEHKKSLAIHLLPAYDEFMVSYADRTASLKLTDTKETITENGIFKPIIVIDGKVEGLWKAVTGKNKTTIELNFFKPGFRSSKKRVASAVKKYSAFLGFPIAVK